MDDMPRFLRYKDHVISLIGSWENSTGKIKLYEYRNEYDRVLVDKNKGVLLYFHKVLKPQKL
jgi:hypothetical protein